MKALLLVDLQKDFMPGGALAVSRGDEVIEVANLLIDHFSLVVSCIDWHPIDHLSFAVNEGKKVGEKIFLKGIEQVLWPIHCVQGTEGAEFAPGLKLGNLAKVFQKGVDKSLDSYSAFYDNAHLRSTHLGDYLKRHKVTTLYILGVATDYCIKYTALDALALGFNVFVVVDGCRGVNLQEGDSEEAFQDMKRRGAELITSKEIIERSSVL